MLVIGGCRSGKSGYALKAAEDIIRKECKPGVFIATAEPFDTEMEDRIRNHQKERGPYWQTIEAPTAVCDAIEGIRDDISVILLDCVTVWITNLLIRETPESGAENEIESEVKRLAAMLKDPPAPVIVVSNEVGMGIVPENKLSRRFRDLAGFANQRLAASVERAVLVAAGIPLVLK